MRLRLGGRRQAVSTLTVLGRPVIAARASSGAALGQDWSTAAIELKLTALVDLEGRQLARQAGDRMRSEEGLSEEKASQFEEIVAASFRRLATGSTMRASCSPGKSLVFRSEAKTLPVSDADTARAFCAICFSPSGDSALRKGLGLK